MKKYIKRIVAGSMIAALAGCSPGGSQENAAHEDQEHAEPEAGVTFNANRGLHVPEATARFIDLRVADVEERRVKSEYRFSAQIHRAVDGLRPASLDVKTSAKAALASADISPEDARVLRRDQSVTVHLDSAASLRGRVAEIEAHAEKSSAHANVSIAIEDPEGQLRAGSFVTVVAPVGGETDVVSVPRPALLRTAEGEFVYTVSGDHFVRTPVKVGAMNDEYVEVTDGLYAGDKVVVNPVMSLWMAELQSIRGGKACADGH